MSDLIKLRTAILLATAIVVIAIVSAYNHHSPVPYWDMWNGYLQFYMNATDGSIASWWAQHNEHRILLARLLFFVDIRWFDGMGYFLIATQLLLLAASAALLVSVLREQAPVPTDRPARHRLGALACLIVALLFLWMQHENLTWAFQSQFFLVQLLPLAALVCLYRSDNGERSTPLFVAACALSVASAATMANGILAPVLLTFTALVLRQSPWRIAILALVTVLTLTAYFVGYQSPPGHGSFLATVQTIPFRFFRYVLRYLGAPVFHLFGPGAFARSAAIAAGALLIGLTLWKAHKTLPHAQQHKPGVALLVYLAYLIATAIGTAGGRAMFGADQALSSRYATPALMAWAAVGILYAPTLLHAAARRPRIAWIVALATLTGLLSVQIKALDTDHQIAFDRSLAAMALALNAHDAEQIKKVFPSVEAVEGIAAQASKRQLSVFGQAPYRDALSSLGKTPTATPRAASCTGTIDHSAPVPDDPRFLKVSGSIDIEDGPLPRALAFTTASAAISGWAVLNRAALTTAPDARHQRIGYSGYIRVQDGEPAMLSAPQANAWCQLTAAPAR